MADHYYSAMPESAHDIRNITVSCLSHTLAFETDAGVFSKDDLDVGSRLLIETAPKLTGRILDLGCGWGPVGAFLAKANPDAAIVLSDINERAASLAKGNLARNGISNAEVVVSDAFSALTGSFDTILTNPPIRTGKQNIYSMFDTAKDFLKEGGSLLIVIRKQQGAPSAVKHLQEVYGNAEVLAKDKGFWIVRSVKD